MRLLGPFLKNHLSFLNNTNNLKSFLKVEQKLLKLSLLLFGITLFSQTASARGLDKAKGILETFKTDILRIVPIIAVLALIGMGIGYATKFVEKDTFIRCAIGLIIVGSAAQIVDMFLK